MEIQQQEIVGNNKLIAQFMGWRIDLYDHLPNRVHKGDQGMDLGVTKYHSSWDWLMPVVEEISSIKSMEFRLSFHGGTAYIIYPRYRGTYVIGIGENRYKDMLEATYTACVEFIKWYNERNY